MSRRSALLLLFFVVACSKKAPPTSSNEAPSAIAASSHIAVPPVAPVGDFLDAATSSSPDGKTPYEQALAYEANGQYWVARLVIEKKALGAEGTKDEAELLARICQVQGDEACVDACGKKLGRKLGMDAGRPPRVAVSASAEVTGENSDLAKAQRLLLQKEYKEARKILEPKVLDGKASTEETRMLKAVCKEEGDRMCMALCDAKLTK